MGCFYLASFFLLSLILTNVLAITLNIDDPGMYSSPKASAVLDLADMPRIDPCSCGTCGIRRATVVQWQSEQWCPWEIPLPSILLVSHHPLKDDSFLFSTSTAH
jgi:hypothetical protein